MVLDKWYQLFHILNKKIDKYNGLEKYVIHEEK